MVTQRDTGHDLCTQTTDCNILQWDWAAWSSGSTGYSCLQDDKLLTTSEHWDFLDGSVSQNHRILKYLERMFTSCLHDCQQMLTRK
jgi:hypothetical protein